ncbi:MAG: CoA-binding protein [Armatimonadetes bacterium]|nr:CoA-binding protein [Armatimonadota bacterium]
MSVRHLEALFDPKSVAVIGASNRAKSVGSVVMRNMLTGGFEGPVMPVNPRGGAIHGVLAYPDVNSLPVVPDLAVVCTSAQTVPSVLDDLGKRGTHAAVVLTAGLSLLTAEDGRTLQEHVVEISRKHQIRILGPNCIGMIVPGIGLNASFAHKNCLPGKIAFVAQSGGLTTGVLDYANSNDIGFSHFLSIGDMVDVDFGDILDYLGSDPTVGSIMLYIEAVKDARKFMSAARAAARNKPVLVVKAGRVAEGARAAASHTGSMAGSGGIIVLDDTTQIVDAALNLAQFYAHESCGQCTPCREGCGWMYGILTRLQQGEATEADIRVLRDLANNIHSRTICFFGASAAMPVQSFLKKFPEEFFARAGVGVPDDWRPAASAK